MNVWTNSDIENVLLQLNQMKLPFRKYGFQLEQGHFNCIGKGAFSTVYDAELRKNHKGSFAIKVIGFGDKDVDTMSFFQITEEQKFLGIEQDNIVKIYDSIELNVWIDENNQVIKANPVNAFAEEQEKGDYLKLQFIVMEKLKPVLIRTGSNIKLYPEQLSVYDDGEIMKLAHDIGNALASAHKRQLLHRDIKLENIFYSDRKKCYKLGDFGISKKTESGMASTVAFTKGYGAPEIVGDFEDKYDNTADVYSFGMMLYVLSNEMRFPDSKNYHVNLKVQYSSGYIVPPPVWGSDQLRKIIEKMCAFYPDDRYQTMEEVNNSLDEISIGFGMKYKREHKVTPIVFGVASAVAGVGVWRMEKLDLIGDYRWLVAALLMLSFFLLNQVSMLKIQDKKYVNLYLKRNRYWIFIFLLFVTLTINDFQNVLWVKMLGQNICDFIATCRPKLVGITGAIFCLVWIVHEWIMIKIEKRR